jgi:hypothetical protein
MGALLYMKYLENLELTISYELEQKQLQFNILLHLSRRSDKTTRKISASNFIRKASYMKYLSPLISCAMGRVAQSV